MKSSDQSDKARTDATVCNRLARFPLKAVYLNLYHGDRFIFKIATHTSLYIEGDEFEWTYANSSDPTSTHGVTYCGIVYERPHQFLYGDWKFWKRVQVGQVSSGFGEGVDSLEELAKIRERLKELTGSQTYVDDGYQFFGNNCWKFCYDALKALNVDVNEGYIEAFNDERHWVPKGTTRFCFTWLSWLAFIVRHLRLVILNKCACARSSERHEAGKRFFVPWDTARRFGGVHCGVHVN
jgi:hypothetical protein